MFGSESLGFMMENIAHGGPGSNPIGTFTIFTWGNGAALASAGAVLSRHGQVYVDSQRRHAFGIDGCTAAAAGDRVEFRDRFARPALRVVYASGAERRVGLRAGAGRVSLGP